MSTFPLRIGTPDGLLFEGDVERVVCRSIGGTCRLLATTWEWKEDIDAERAQAAKKRAEEMIAKGGLTDQEYKMASAKLQRALVRLSVKE